MLIPFKIKSRFFQISLQIIAVILYLDMLATPKSVTQEGEPQLAFWNFVIQLAIMVAIGMLLTPKAPKGRKIVPTGLEEFDIPTAEEGRSIQVLFGKKFVLASNVVWFGHLKSQAIKA